MATANATCYFPNGDPDILGQSCNPDATASHCCENTHVCLSNGLCFDTVYNHIIRVSCTDASWLDEKCPQYCKNDTTTIYGAMRQCDDSDTFWVCREDPTDCTNSFSLRVGYIDDHRDVTLSAIVALPSPYSAASIGSATITTTVTATAMASASASASATSKSGTSTTVGLGVGLGVGFPLLAALCVSLFLLHRAHQKINALGSKHQVARSELQSQADAVKWQPKHEVDSGYVLEVPGSRP